MSIVYDDFKFKFAEAVCESPKGYMVNEIFTRYQTLQDLINVTQDELLQIKGIGPKKAQQILAVLGIVQYNPLTEKPYYIRGPKDAADYVMDEMRWLQQEHLIALYLNTKNAVMLKHTVSIGTLNSSLVHPREVFREAVKHSAAALICIHNHPSGDTSPSKEDLDVTKKLIECGKMIDVHLLDHVIIGDGCFKSIKNDYNYLF